MKGYFGRYLHVDLSRRRITDREIPTDWLSNHLGGRGICARLLIDLGIVTFLRERRSAYHEGNVLLFGTGPLQGSGAPGAGRHAVMSVSPRTQSVSDSYAGGFWGHELGRSGYDGIAFVGKSETPVYLALLDAKAALHDAAGLWGSGVAETDATLKSRHGGRVLSIGVAGENVVPMACIMNDVNRAAGRPGFGAVMGSKKLKAVVVRGDAAKTWHSETQLTSLSRTFASELTADPAIGGFGKYGTTGSVMPLNELGILPTRNFAQGRYEEAASISGERMSETILTGRDTCTGCPILCKRRVSGTVFGEKITENLGGPEYETLAAFGSLCANGNLPAIALANQLCNEYGLDTISVGNTLAFAMEAEEKGLLHVGLRWGDAQGMIRLLHCIARKEGPGTTLAAGVEALSRDIGADFGVSVEGLELAMHDPRGKKGLAISYASSPRGGTHLEAMHDTMAEGSSPLPELGVTAGVDRRSWERKPELCKLFEDLYSFTNSVIMCGHVSWDFVTGSYNPYPRIRDLLASAIGNRMEPKDMILIGERNYAILALLSGIAGRSHSDDAFPRRLTEALPSGGSAGERIDPERLKEALGKYYQLRGYDELGPTPEKLAQLGLADLAAFREGQV